MSVYFLPLLVVLASLLCTYLGFRYYLYYQSRVYSSFGYGEKNRRLMNQALLIMLVSGLVFVVSLLYLVFLSRNPIFPAAISTASPGEGAERSTPAVSPTPRIPSTGGLTPSPMSSPTPGAGFARIGNTNGFGANVRSEPGLNFESLIQLSDGSRVELTGEAQAADGFNWQRIRLEDGRQGWIADNFLIPEQ